MVAKDRQNKTDSPKVEVGEIDTRAPFNSVKDAVNLFGEGAFSGEKITIRKIKPQSAERILVKETKLHLAQKELDKLKERLKISETTKTGAISELERAKRAVEDLTKKLEIVNEAKESTIKETETAKTQAKQLDNGVLKHDLENIKEQYDVVFIELDSAKQELRRIRHDCETTVEEKTEASNQESESEITRISNLDRVDEISKEILLVQETIEQVKLATMKAHQEQENIYTEKTVQKLDHKAALEESGKKLLELRKRVDPETSKDLETKFAETNSEIRRLQMEMENSRVSDLDSLKNVTSDLDDAKESLRKVAEEEIMLKKTLELLKIEFENVKKEHEELKEKEAETESVAGNLNIELQKSKTELEKAVFEEAKVTAYSDEMMSSFQQLVSESENAKRESEEMKKKGCELKMEAEAMGVGFDEVESKLKIALMEAEEAKKAERKALEEIKEISERTDAARASSSGSGSKITISREEFESLSRKVGESERLAVMKVEAAMAQVAAVTASEKEAVKKLEAIQKEIEEMKAETEATLKRAEMAEAAKKAVEGELKRWRERERQAAAALILQETEMQSPPQKQETRKGNLGGIFHRKKSHVGGGGASPSYLPAK